MNCLIVFLHICLISGREGWFAYEWDGSKRRNTRKSRGIDFVDMVLFDWDTALTRTDKRLDYGEAWLSSIGFIKDHLNVCIWCWRRDVVRVISFRKASDNRQAMFRKILHGWWWRSARTGWGVVCESQSWAAKITQRIAQTADIDSSCSICHHTLQKRGVWLAKKD